MEEEEKSLQTERSKTGKMEIRVARSVAEVEALRSKWASWPGHRDSDIDFFLMIIRSYSEALRPHVMVLCRDGEPEAIMVGRLEEKRLSFRLGYLFVPGPKVRCLTFVYGAIHGDGSQENIAALLQGVMKCLEEGEGDLALLEFVPLESSLYHLALELSRWRSRDTLPSSQGHEIMVVPDSIDEVYRRMSAHRRRTVQSVVRRLKAYPTGEPRIAVYCSIGELDRLFTDAEQVAQKTYQRGLGVGFADTPRVRKRLEYAAERGSLRAYVLYLENRPLAFWIGMMYNTTFVGEYMGYDPEYRQWSPGTFLLMHSIEGFCKRAYGDIVKELDFGLGSAEYKEMLSSKHWLEASVFIFSPTMKGFMLKSLRGTTRLAERIARRVLRATKLLPRLKRSWRDHMARKSRA